KVRRGGKGLGRFIWLKAFERVEIDSHFRGADGTLLHRRFTFEARDDELPSAVTPSDQSAPLTTVRFTGFRHPYCDECPRSLDAMAQRLVGHFLPLFLDPRGPSVLLSDDFEQINLAAFFQDNFEAFSTRRSFRIADCDFTLHGFRLHNAAADN